MTKDELARLKAIAHGSSEYDMDMAFWQDGGTTIRALIAEIERLQSAVEPPAPLADPYRPQSTASCPWCGQTGPHTHTSGPFGIT
jgi:hypothetical protein